MNSKAGLSRIYPFAPVAAGRKRRCLAFETLENRQVLSAVAIPADLIAEPSGQVVVPVQIDDAVDVRGVEIEIRYDTELLDADSVTAGSVWPAGSAEVVANVDDEAGSIAVWVFAAEGLDSGGGSLVEVAFTVCGAAAGGSSIEIDLAEVVLNEGEITVNPQPQLGQDSTDGVVTVSGGDDEPFTPVELGEVDFTRLESLNPSAGELWFRLTAVHDGWFTVQAVDEWTSAELAFQLYESADRSVTVATSSLQDGNPRLDYEVQQGESYLLQVTGTASDASLPLANLVHEAGTAITVYGTDEGDVFVFDAGTSRAITINGVCYEYEATEVSTVEFDGGEGRDMAWFYDSAGNESLEAWPDRATLTNGAGDAVQDYLVEVSGIEDLLAYATRGGTDSAVLHGSEGNDKFKSYEEYVRLRAVDCHYTLRAKKFDTIVGDSGSGGKDQAVFNGSSGNDTFTYLGGDDSARIEGQGRDHTATGFNSVVAYSGGGQNDVAYFTDTPETNDILYLRSHKAQLVGDGVKVTARTFDCVHATASESGFDVARMYDTTGADHLEVAGDTARLYRYDGDSQELLYEVVAFERVKAYSTAGDDTINVGENTIDLYLFGWDE